MRRCLTVGLVLFLVWAPGAFAAEGSWEPLPTDAPFTDTLTQKSLTIAGAYWGVEPPCPVTTFLYNEQSGIPGVGLRAAPGCRIWVDRTWKASIDRGYRSAYCVMIVHEYGHLLGYQHTSDPNNVMYGGEVSRYAVPECRAFEWRPTHRRRHRHKKHRWIR